MPTVADVVTPDPVTVDATTTVREAAVLMRDEGIGDVLVTDRGQLVGIVTDRDLVVRVLAAGGASGDPVGQVCSGSLVTLAPGDDVAQAARVMAEHGVRRLPVVDEGGIVGIVSSTDLER
ncbi:CBS domain-containing protein [Cellulomonas marina]|uniref:CBS domain-containing protein n=1 Tax=Cellulomonas marina TaxID=988821 RepID=A0A1I0ZFC9_9CELL|nr:CBS domain-containing protein [Cellulomonas marina]GIG30755.1 oxidoreductase [Cellulomonas marina]SFB23118.1 CBS domain-containing protein [Cellulomonas marina]